MLHTNRRNFLEGLDLSVWAISKNYARKPGSLALKDNVLHRRDEVIDHFLAAVANVKQRIFAFCEPQESALLHF
jgi:hypothetical protein